MERFLSRIPTGALLLLITGCSTAGPTSQSAALPGISFVKPAYSANESLVFVGNTPGNTVNIYRAADLPSNPSPIATISTEQNCPYGLAADKVGTIYVAAGCNVTGGDVEEYPKGSTTVQKTITKGISHPSGLAIDKQQTLYVIDSSPASIEEYAPGATKPKKSITGPFGQPFGAALDANGNLYVADFMAGAVFELPAGGSSVTNLNLQDLVEPLGVAVDQQHGFLWVTDGKGQKVNVYQLGSATPFESIGGFAFPYAVSVENKGQPTDTAVVADAGNSAQNGSVLAFKPGTYTPYATLTTDVSQPSAILITKP